MAKSRHMLVLYLALLVLLAPEAPGRMLHLNEEMIQHCYHKWQSNVGGIFLIWFRFFFCFILFGPYFFF